jgi:hypothetical protein
MALARMEADIGRHVRSANEKLWTAARTGDTEEIRRIIGLGASPNDGDTAMYGRTALHIAAYSGQEEACEELVCLGAHLNATSDPLRWTPLHYAAQVHSPLSCVAPLLMVSLRSCIFLRVHPRGCVSVSVFVSVFVSVGSLLFVHRGVHSVMSVRFRFDVELYYRR